MELAILRNNFFFELLYQPHLTKSPQLRQARIMTRTKKNKNTTAGRLVTDYGIMKDVKHTPTHIARQPFFEWRCNTKREARAASLKLRQWLNAEQHRS